MQRFDVQEPEKIAEVHPQNLTGTGGDAAWFAVSGRRGHNRAMVWVKWASELTAGNVSAWAGVKNPLDGGKGVVFGQLAGVREQVAGRAGNEVARRHHAARRRDLAGERVGIEGGDDLGGAGEDSEDGFACLGERRGQRIGEGGGELCLEPCGHPRVTLAPADEDVDPHVMRGGEVGDDPARRVQATERATSTGRRDVVDSREERVLRVEQEADCQRLREHRHDRSLRQPHATAGSWPRRTAADGRGD